MNTPQQAELYRKAIETVELCAKHGIAPKVRISGCIFNLPNSAFINHIEDYEFPVTVIEGQLVWMGDYIYDAYGRKVQIEEVQKLDGCCSLKTDGRWYSDISYTRTQPKQPLCEVEGKPVYKGDKLWFIGSVHVKAREITVKYYKNDIFKLQATDTGWFKPSECSWNPPKRTVMVELLVEDAEKFLSPYAIIDLGRVGDACRKALANK